MIENSKQWNVAIVSKKESSENDQRLKSLNVSAKPVQHQPKGAHMPRTRPLFFYKFIFLKNNIFF